MAFLLILRQVVYEQSLITDRFCIYHQQLEAKVTTKLATMTRTGIIRLEVEIATQMPQNGESDIFHQVSGLSQPGSCAHFHCDIPINSINYSHLTHIFTIIPI